jgi:hypothetical protein
LERRNF